MRKKQIGRTEELLATNESAMTQIDNVMIAISEINTVSGHATMDLETAMKEMNYLAQRASSYSSTD